MDSPLQIERHDSSQIWTINLPHLGNAITEPGFLDALDLAVDAANGDETVTAVILTGQGKIFSAGGNVKEMAERRGMFALDPVSQRRAYIDGIQRVPRAIDRLEMPIIGAINGGAIGAGCDLAMMCDIRIASERAFFAESFVQIGLIPGDGGSWFLPRAVGYERAAEMTFTGDRVDAGTAQQWGMVSDVVPHEDLLRAATALAGRIGKNPGHAVRMAKRLLQESRTSRLDTVLGMAAAMQPLAHQHPEHESRLAKWRTS